MASTTAAQVLTFVSVGIVSLNILIAAIQLHASRSHVEKALLLFWLGTGIGALANAMPFGNSLIVTSTAGAGSFLSMYFLGSFFTDFHELEFPGRRLIVFFAAMLVLGFVLSLFDVSFMVSSLPILCGAAAPMLTALFIVLKAKRTQLSTIQWVFVATTGAMSVHFLDWSWFRQHPDFFLTGLIIAIMIFQILTILTPMMSNELALRRRNEQLENDMKAKVQALTAAELKLWEANRLASLGRLAGGVAHELNTPLQVIDLQAEEMRMCLAEYDETAHAELVEGTHRIQQMVARIARMTDDLRIVAQDRHERSLRTVDLRPLIHEVLLSSTPRINDLQVGVRVDLPADPLLVRCSSTEISKILRSLLDNALDAVAKLERREIFISAQRREKRIEFSIADSGTVDQELIPRLMEPFYTTKPLGKGFGMGLTISRSIAEHHGGTIFLDPESKNTCFVLDLPVAVD